MARKPRLAYECFSCGKRFKSAQAVRGHRRHCRYPRLKRQAEAQAEHQPVPTTPEGKRPGPLSQEAKLLLLNVQVEIEQLQRATRHFATVANIMAGMNVAGQYAKAKDWAEMYWVLDNCLRDLDPMLPLFRLDRGVLFRTYDIIRNLRERWIEQRMCGFYRAELEPDGLDESARTVLRAEEAQLTRLVEHLKRLVVAAP